MDLRRLRYFCLVAEEGNVTRAATRAGIQQAPLSQQIIILEREIGARLFHRNPRGVELTASGQALFREAPSIFASIDRAVATTQRAARGEGGLIRIGLTSSACFHAFPPAVIRAFRQAYPHVVVEFRQESTPALLELLRGERIDAAFIRTTLAAPDGVDVISLVDEAMVAALPSHHSLADVNSPGDLKIKALAKEAFVGYPRSAGAGLYDAVIAACRANGFSPDIRSEAPQIVSTLSLVAAGFGVTIVPSSMRRAHLDGVVYRTLSGAHLPNAQLNLAAPLSARTEPSLQAFLALARAAAERFVARKA